MSTQPANADFFIDTGDTLPAIQVVLSDANGQILDLTLATSIIFKMRPVNDPTLITINAACSIIGDPANGTVAYNWTSDDTSNAGDYYGQFHVTFSNGKTQTFPNDSYKTISITAAVDSPPQTQQGINVFQGMLNTHADLIASSSVLGHVKIGSGVTIAGDGTISVPSIDTSTFLLKSGNLSGLLDLNAAHTNLGLGALALVNSLTKSDVGLGSVDNVSDANKPVSTLQATADALVLSTAKTYADGLVVGLLDDRGNYDASSNAFPSSGGSGASGAILKGDLWYISVSGTLGAKVVSVGSSIRALVDSPGQTSGNWDILNVGLGYTPENSANKDIANGYAGLTAGSLLKTSEFPAFTGDITTSAGGVVTAIGAGKVTAAMIASMTSAQLASILSDETGSGPSVFGISPALVTPTISVGQTTSALTDLLINPTTKASGNLIDLQVNGASKFKLDFSGAATLAGVLQLPNGSATNPSLRFADNLGIYEIGSTQLGISIGTGLVTSFAAGQVWNRSDSAQFIFGSGADLRLTRFGANVLQIGDVDGATAAAQSIRMMSVAAGATNTAGQNFTLKMSAGTGTGIGGSFIVQVAPAGTTGTAQNALVTALTINGANGNAVFVSNINAVNFIPASTGAVSWSARAEMKSPADGVISLFNQADTDFNRLQFGGTTFAFPALKRSNDILIARLADDSANTAIAVKTVAGAVSDASFASAPPDGTFAFDSTNKKFYTRLAGSWFSVALS